LPPWITAKSESGLTTPGEDKLHAGERAAMQLAELMRAGIILLDEKAARLIAMERGPQVTGALGIPGEATREGGANQQR
jgi:predicted nucleic acid-binding protein